MIRIGLALASLVMTALLGFRGVGIPPLVAGSASSVVADTTVVDSVAAGSILIRMLPSSISGEPVSSFRAVVIPARGWMYGRSFFWRVPSDARGSYTFLFEAVRESTTDTVRVQVVVTEPE